MSSKAPKKRAAKPRFPQIPSEAEIILKESYCVDDTESTEVPIPEIIMLANREGLRYLGEYFLYLAEALKPSADDCDPDDHQHSGTMFPNKPFNYELSDRIELRIGVLSDENRPHVEEKYGISGRSRKHGSLIERYTRLAEMARAGEGAWGGGGYSASSQF